MDPMRRNRSVFSGVVMSTALILGAAGCSDDTTTTVFDEDPIEGTLPDQQQMNAPANGVEQGTEGGLNLDSGNVPGSEDEKAEDIAQRPEGVYNESLGEEDTVGDE